MSKLVIPIDVSQVKDSDRGQQKVRVAAKVGERVVSQVVSVKSGKAEITLDVVFDERSMYERVRATGVLGPALFARLYNVRPEDVLFTEYPAGNAFKATIPRLVASGDVGDTDVYGAQQHAPLLDVEIPI